MCGAELCVVRHHGCVFMFLPGCCIVGIFFIVGLFYICSRSLLFVLLHFVCRALCVWSLCGSFLRFCGW